MGDFTIQISSNLVNRLADDPERLKKKTKRTKPKIKQESRNSLTKVIQKHISDDSGTPKETSPQGWPQQPPLFLPITPAQSANTELEAIKSLLKDSDKVVERLQRQEENMLQEVTHRAKDLRDEEFKLPYQKPTPCMSESNACLLCYGEHAMHPLKCAHLVKHFADCTRRIRQEVSSVGK